MAMAVNAAKARLKKNQLAVGIGVRLVRNVDIIKVMKAAGFDWLFLDLEHGAMSIENACEIATAAQDSGIAPIVRVPYGELAMATRILDGGALGIVIPHVDTAEEAREIADKLRYAPIGHRSVGGGQAQFDYAPMKMADMTKKANDNTLITVMIETPKAVRNAEAIAAVPGIDALLVGSSDLSVEMGIPGENGHPKIQEAVDKVVAACKKHRKFPGMGGAYSEELLQLYIGKGMKMLLAGNDLPMLVNAARTHQAKVRAMATVRAKPKAAAKRKR
jgi:4-hydroxy-2-oxoheptanedioate aldolase